MKRLRQSLFNATRHASRSTRFLVIAGILGGAFLLLRPALPEAMRVSFQLPEALRALDLEYEQDGAVVRTARFSWSDESPTVLRHDPELLAGATRVTATLHDVEGRAWSVERTVHVKTDRVNRVDLRGERTRP